MKQIEECKNQLLLAIRESSACKEFERYREALSADPGKLAAVNAFREKVYRYQLDPEAFGGDEAARELFEERLRIRTDAEIAGFLNTELELCRLLQRLCTEILNVTDMSLDSLGEVIK